MKTHHKVAVVIGIGVTALAMFGSSGSGRTDMPIALTTSDKAASVGDIVRYTAVVTNKGDRATPADSLRFDTSDSGAKAVYHGGTCPPAAGINTCHLPSLAPGDTARATLLLRMASPGVVRVNAHTAADNHSGTTADVATRVRGASVLSSKSRADDTGRPETLDGDGAAQRTDGGSAAQVQETPSGGVDAGGGAYAAKQLALLMVGAVAMFLGTGIGGMLMRRREDSSPEPVAATENSEPTVSV